MESMFRFKFLLSDRILLILFDFTMKILWYIKKFVTLHFKGSLAFMSSSYKMNWINIIYVLFWGGISFISSFMGVLDGKWSKIISGDLLHDIFNPLFVWIIAFFGDYLYTVFSVNNKTQILDETWTKVSYILVEVLFIVLLLSIHLTNGFGRTTCVAALYICVMGLKTSSLYALCPRQKIEAV